MDGSATGRDNVASYEWRTTDSSFARLQLRSQGIQLSYEFCWQQYY